MISLQPQSRWQGRNRPLERLQEAFRRIAGGIVEALRGLRGTGEASIFEEPPIPRIAIDIDRLAAARYGLNVSDIANLIQIGIGGAPVSRVFVKDRI